MKGILIEKTGGTEVLQYKTDLPVPSPKEGEILVKNTFIGINYIDTYFRSGLYTTPKPEILGREAEGHIVSAGPGNTYDLSTGDHVVGMASSTYAEYTAMPAAKAIKIPKDIPESHAAAAILQGLTALTLVRETHPVKKGDWVLVHAAAGGVGLWLCQILRAIGAKTIGTASTADKIKLAKENGAGEMIDYSHENVVERVKELTGGEGVAAVFDGVGKSTFDDSLECVARKGTMVSFGNASGAVPPFTIAYVDLFLLSLSRTRLERFGLSRGC